MVTPGPSEDFSPGVGLEGWVRNMQAGRTRTHAAKELASGLNLSQKGVADLNEMRTALNRLEMPAAGQEILNILTLQEIIYLALAIKWGSGKTRNFLAVSVSEHTTSVSRGFRRGA
eukprot:3976596-Amphidinium_carterae.1